MGDSGASVGDRDLWAAVCAGDERAFGVVFDRYYGPVVRYAARLVPSRADADDVAAMAFLVAWQKRERVRLTDGVMLPWLFVTAGNLSRNVQRARARHERFLRRLEYEATIAPGLGHDAVDANDQVESAFDRVSARDREVLALCVIEALPPREVALLLNVPVGAVRTRLHRAKQRLAHELTGTEDLQSLEGGLT